MRVRKTATAPATAPATARAWARTRKRTRTRTWTQTPHLVVVVWIGLVVSVSFLRSRTVTALSFSLSFVLPGHPETSHHNHPRAIGSGNIVGLGIVLARVRPSTRLWLLGASSRNDGNGTTTATTTTATTSSPRSLSQPDLVRGQRYESANSTLPSPAVIAAKLGVRPTEENATARTWKRAWKLHKRFIPLLHSTDGCKPPDSSLNIACMWWKALSGNDPSSPVHDHGLAYDLLPSGWRRLVSKRLRRFYPRLHHANVELRTAYLDHRIIATTSTIVATNNNDNNNTRVAQQQNKNQHNQTKTTKIRLVCMGAGYDTRGVKMLERGVADEVIELDLEGVVTAKERLFRRLKRRRPWLESKSKYESKSKSKQMQMQMPTLVPSDFNKLEEVERTLRGVLQLQPPSVSGNNYNNNNDGNTCDTHSCWHTIFVFEGVLIYLDEGVPSALLGLASRVLREQLAEQDGQQQQQGSGGSLCFADRLENVPGGDIDAARAELSANGWELEDWSPKPGLARHMGSARLATAASNDTKASP